MKLINKVKEYIYEKIFCYVCFSLNKDMGFDYGFISPFRLNYNEIKMRGLLSGRYEFETKVVIVLNGRYTNDTFSFYVVSYRRVFRPIAYLVKSFPKLKIINLEPICDLVGCLDNIGACRSIPFSHLSASRYRLGYFSFLSSALVKYFEKNRIIKKVK